jgi:geranylgeranyl diphosphate synthase type I|tara:strand:- start:545 stop:1441 length:897 start_codon:yes stop_codon:yes gene_type:complete
MEFNNSLDNYKKIIDNELIKFFDNGIKKDDDFLKESYGYLKEFTLRPGKRLRPIATIMSFKAINDSDESKIYPVCIVPELIHASSLIHDDMMDEDLLRRDKPTMHKIFEAYFKKNFSDSACEGDLFNSHSKRFSVSMAVLQGNILFSLSKSCILDSNLDDSIKKKSLEIFNDAYARINEGQMLDLCISADKDIKEEDYVKMAAAKTGPLFSSSIKFGALLNNAKDFQLEALDKYADSMALAFQIHDDMMDLSKTMKDAGTYAKNKTVEAKKYLEKAKLNEEGFKFFNELADFVVERKV